MTTDAAPITIDPTALARVGTVDERYQAFNLEMLEVTGGRFWKPYDSESSVTVGGATGESGDGTADEAGDTPVGMDPEIYAYRPPKDLANSRLRTLAAALGPSYLRVSGTWANTTYVAADGDAPATAPDGFNSVLTADQWRGVVAFANAIDAPVVTSFAISPGARDGDGTWSSAQAERLFDLTDEAGGTIAAAEFMNEPTMAAMGGAPDGYDAAAYLRDFAVFRAFARHRAPDMVVLGPGSVGENMLTPEVLEMAGSQFLATRDLLAGPGADIDGFSYHHYGTVSQRCAGMGVGGTSPDHALSERWLARTDASFALYRDARDELAPGKPIWLTETAQAACGGDRWAAWFIDTFRYLDQLGRLAKAGVRVVMHNTLAASDYGLLDERTYEPRPNYWAALLWRRFMGTDVLDAGVALASGRHVYAHSLRDQPGGVALLVINTSRTDAVTIDVRAAGERYTLSSADIESPTALLNGTELRLGPDDALPSLAGDPFAPGPQTFAPATSTFLAVPAP